MSKVISDYMGWNPLYTIDWNMLMEVVDKIENSGDVTISIGNKKCSITVWEEFMFDKRIEGKSNLEATLQCAKEFIKWKNSL